MWSEEQKEKIKANDDAFSKHLKEKGIDRNSKEASTEWHQSEFKKKQMEILGKKQEEPKKEEGIKRYDGKDVSSEEFKQIRNNPNVKSASNKGVSRGDNKVKHEVIFDDKTSIEVWA